MPGVLPPAVTNKAQGVSRFQKRVLREILQRRQRHIVGGTNKNMHVFTFMLRSNLAFLLVSGYNYTFFTA